MGPSEPDNDLLRESTRLEVEEVGVAWPEPAGDWLVCGDAVPEELSFFFASLLPSLSLSRVRESTRCLKPFIMNQKLLRWRDRQQMLLCEERVRP